MNHTQQSCIVPLNLPPIDSSRLRQVVLTPEEWVRQHFVDYMIKEKQFPASLMANEIGLELNNTRRRCDTVVFDRTGNPMMIIEYKAPGIVISQKVFDQIVRYNHVFHAPYLVVTHYCCRIDYDTHTYTFLREIPDYTLCCAYGQNR